MTCSHGPAGAPPVAQCGAPAAGRNVPGGTTAPSGGGRCRGASAKPWPGSRSAQLGQAPGRQRPGEQRQPRPVRAHQSRISSRPLTQGHRELMAQHHDLGFLPPPLPPRQAQHRQARVTTRKISFKPTSRRSSHASPNQDLPTRHRSLDRADGVPQSICPGGAGFRHPQVRNLRTSRGVRSTTNTRE